MKLFVKILLFLLLLAIALPFIGLGPGGKPLLSWKEIKLPSFNTPDGVKEMPGMLSESVIKVYKWQDEKGQWHYGEQPPEHVKAVLMEVDAKLNTFKAKTREEATKRVEEATKADKPKVEIGKALETYNPENIEQLRHDAQALKQQLNQRVEQQNQLLHSN